MRPQGTFVGEALAAVVAHVALLPARHGDAVHYGHVTVEAVGCAEDAAAPGAGERRLAGVDNPMDSQLKGRVETQAASRTTMGTLFLWR